MSKQTANQEAKPEYVLALEAVYGVPSQEGFGSAVFFEQVGKEGDLEELSRKYYQYFTGELWERWGEEAWMSPWKETYKRPQQGKPDIVAELRAIEDPDTQMQLDMILGVSEDPKTAEQALSGAYDAPEVSDLRVYNIGDGEAMSGLLVAGQRENGEATFLTFLYD